MATVPSLRELPLEQGDRLDRATFRARYQEMPEGVKAELIGGMVYLSTGMASPVSRAHSLSQFALAGWLCQFVAHTPGTEGLDNATTVLGEDEVQPDLGIRVHADNGGTSHVDAEGYIQGPVELVAEIALSTASNDLHGKRDLYEVAGVREYLVVLVAEERVAWFVRQDDKFVELAPGGDGIFRSPGFAGLWLDPAALVRADTRKLLEVLGQGLASPEHEALVTRLAAGEGLGR